MADLNPYEGKDDFYSFHKALVLAVQGGCPNKNHQVERQVERQVKRQLDLQHDLLPGVLPDVLHDVLPDDFKL